MCFQRKICRICNYMIKSPNWDSIVYTWDEHFRSPHFLFSPTLYTLDRTDHLLSFNSSPKSSPAQCPPARLPWLCHMVGFVLAMSKLDNMQFWNMQALKWIKNETCSHFSPSLRIGRVQGRLHGWISPNGREDARVAAGPSGNFHLPLREELWPCKEGPFSAERSTHWWAAFISLSDHVAEVL